MAIESLSTVAPEQLSTLVISIENALKALGGLLIVYVAISLWELLTARHNQKLLLSIQKDIHKIEKKLKIKGF